MELKYFYKNIDESQKKFLASYMQEKIGRFEKLLGQVPDDEELLEIKAEKFAKKEAYRVELILHTPRKKYVAAEDDHTVREAVDLCTDKLLAQLRKDFSS